MPKQASSASPTSLRTYSSHWRGPLLLACRKCEKRLKASSSHPFKLKKALKCVQREDHAPQPIHILSTGCMKLCPKDGITVCPQSQLAQGNAEPRLFILRTRDDVESLYHEEKQRRASYGLIP